jgi:hypothetical protein
MHSHVYKRLVSIAHVNRRGTGVVGSRPKVHTAMWIMGCSLLSQDFLRAELKTATTRGLDSQRRSAKGQAAWKGYRDIRTAICQIHDPPL